MSEALIMKKKRFFWLFYICQIHKMIPFSSESKWKTVLLSVMARSNQNVTTVRLWIHEKSFICFKSVFTVSWGERKTLQICFAWFPLSLTSPLSPLLHFNHNFPSFSSMLASFFFCQHTVMYQWIHMPGSYSNNFICEASSLFSSYQ